MPFPKTPKLHARNLTGDNSLEGQYVNADAMLIIGHALKRASPLRTEIMEKGHTVPVRTYLIADADCPGLYWLAAKQGIGGSVLYTWFDPTGVVHYQLLCASDDPATASSRRQAMFDLAHRQKIWRTMHATGMPENIVRSIARSCGVDNAQNAIDLAARILHGLGGDVRAARKRGLALIATPPSQLPAALKPHPASKLNPTNMKKVVAGATRLLEQTPV